MVSGSCRCPAVLLFALMSAPTAVEGQGNQPPPVVTVQIAAPGGGCPGQPESCLGYVTTWPLGQEADLFVVVARVDSLAGIGGVSFGICYDADVQVQSWTFCASGLQFPSEGWPGPNSGIVLTWNTATDCQRTVLGNEGVHATAGYFRVMAESPGYFFVTKHSGISSDAIVLYDCGGNRTFLPYGGFASFGILPSYNPCVFDVDGFPTCRPTPVVPETWGRLKALYGSPPP